MDWKRVYREEHVALIYHGEGQRGLAVDRLCFEMVILACREKLFTLENPTACVQEGTQNILVPKCLWNNSPYAVLKDF